MDNFKKIIKYFLNTLTILLLCVLVIAVYGKLQVLILKKSYSTYFGYSLFEVASGSMEPALSIDDVIIVNTNIKDVHVNDIITYELDKSIITHRVISINGDNIITKGDYNNTADGKIERKNIIGKVVKVLPKFNIWKNTLTEPKNLLFLFLTLLLFDFALAYKPPKKESKSKKIIIEETNNPKELTKQKDIIDEKELLEFTRKIDIKQINELIEELDIKLDDGDINKLCNKIEEVKTDDNKKLELNEDEEKFLEYTIRLDLKKLQGNISDKIK